MDVTHQDHSGISNSRSHGRRRSSVCGRSRKLLKRLSSSIWLKLSLFVGLLVLGTSGVLALVLWEKAHKELVLGIKLRLTTIVTLKAEQLNTYVNSELSKAELVASRVILRRLVFQQQSRNLTQAELLSGRQDLEAAIKLLPEFLDITAVNNDGAVILSTTFDQAGLQAAGGDSPAGLSNEAVLHPPYVISPGFYGMKITTPIMYEQERVGTLTAVVNATDLRLLVYSKTGLQSTGEVNAGYPNADNSAIIFVVPPRLDTSVTTTNFTKALRMAIESKAGFANGVRDYRGKLVAVAYAPVGYLNWGMVAKEDEAEAYRPVHNFEDVIVISIVCILLAGLIASYIIAKVATGPIVHLSRAAEALASGDMHARVSRKHRLWEDEVDALRHTFNNMADQLSASYNTLESKVAERTTELAEANTVLAGEVTERKAVEKELEAARNLAEAANKMKSEWLANMSHEIRTPLNGVINCTELCLDTRLTDEQHEYLELALFSAKHLLRLITDILDFSKIEAGKLNMESIEFSLYDQMEHAVAVLAARAHKKGLELFAHPKEGVPDVLVGDPSRLFQIFINLLGNSIKFTNSGRVVLSVSAESGNSDPSSIMLHFTVEDTGIGIPKDKQSLLFQAFSQVNASTTRLYGGTGLGLLISSKLAHAMGGRMWVDSDEGVGSTFSFTSRLMVPPPAFKPQTPFAATLPLLHDVKTLLVDSSAASSAVLTDMLHRWTMRVEAVHDGDAAFHRLEEEADRGEPFQLLLLDLHVPSAETGRCHCEGLVDLLHLMPHLLADRGRRRTRGGGAHAPAHSHLLLGGGEGGGSALEGQGSGGSFDSLGLPEVELELDLPDWLQNHSQRPGAGSTDNSPGVQSPSEGPTPVASPRDVVRRPPRHRLRQSRSSSGDYVAQPPDRGGGSGSACGSLSPRVRPGAGAGADRWLPLVILTSPDHSDIARCRVLGIDAYVSKPVKRSVLMRSLHNALQLPQRLLQQPSSPLFPQEGGGEGEGAEKVVKESLHILVAEDNVINQRVALTLLAKWGHTTALASTGAEAVEKYEAEAFDVVLMDVQMPVLDGLGATVQIRENEKASGKYTPIVAMTAHAMHGDGAKCIAAGMDSYISKPLNSTKLQEILRLVAEKRLPRAGSGAAMIVSDPL